MCVYVCVCVCVCVYACVCVCVCVCVCFIRIEFKSCGDLSRTDTDSCLQSTNDMLAYITTA